MKRNSVGLSSFLGRIAVLLAVVLFVNVAHPEETRALRNLQIGDKMPSFVLKNFAGGNFDSKSLKNKVSIIVFFRTEHRNSKKALKSLVEIKEQFKNKPLQIVAIGVEEKNLEVVKKSVSEFGVQFVFVEDSKRELYGKVGVIVTPTTLLFDRDQVFRYYEASHPPRYQLSLRLAVQVLLGEISDEQRNIALSGVAEPKVSSERKKAKRFLALGRRLYERKLYDETTTKLQEAVAADPEFWDARTFLGEMLVFHNEARGRTCYEEAKKHFQMVIEKSKPANRAKLGLASVYSRLGQYDEALKLLEELRSRKVNRARLYYEFGRVSDAIGKKDKALSYFRSAAEASLGESAEVRGDNEVSK